VIGRRQVFKPCGTRYFRHVKRLHVIDWVPSALLLLAGAVELGVAHHSEFRGPLLVSVLGVLLAPLPLVWRRRAPIAAVVASGGILFAWVYGAYGVSHQAPLVTFLTALLMLFSLGLYSDARLWRRVVVVAVAFALVSGLPQLVFGGRHQVGNVVPTWILFAFVFSVGLALHRRQQIAVLFEERAAQAVREREQAARAAVAEERGRIARELHDVIAHNVSVMVIQAGAAGLVLEDQRPDVRNALTTIEQTGRQTVDEMRRLLGVLRRADESLSLAPQPSLVRLEALVDQMRGAGLPVELRIVGEPVELAAGVDLSAFRIVQEALTNALKHAGPARALVVVRYTSDALELEVSDDGSGNGAGGGTGHGLIGMRERVAMLGGDLVAGREAGGYRLRARLPLGMGRS
jgi:signal transduction histidine kinase